MTPKAASNGPKGDTTVSIDPRGYAAALARRRVARQAVSGPREGGASLVLARDVLVVHREIEALTSINRLLAQAVEVKLSYGASAEIVAWERGLLDRSNDSSDVWGRASEMLQAWLRRGREAAYHTAA